MKIYFYDTDLDTEWKRYDVFGVELEKLSEDEDDNINAAIEAVQESNDYSPPPQPHFEVEKTSNPNKYFVIVRNQ